MTKPTFQQSQDVIVPLLKSRHFKDPIEPPVLKMGVHGLTMDEIVNGGDRWRIISDIGTNLDAEGEKKRQALLSMPPTRVVSNPKDWPLNKINQHFLAMQAAYAPQEAVNIEVDQPASGSYENHWTAAIEKCDGDEYTIEGQQVFLVAFKDHKPVGFVNLGLRLKRDETDELDICFSLNMVYANPTERGKAVGIDLSVATGWVVEDVLRAMHRAAPPKQTINVVIDADYLSIGGKLFVDHISGCAQMIQEEMSEDENRSRKKKGYVGLYAGD